MKTPRTTRRFVPTLAGAAFVVVAAAAPFASAAPTNFYWDTNGATTGLGTAGTFDFSSAHWSTTATGNVATTGWVNGTTTSDHIGIFNGNGTSTVTNNTTVTAYQVQIGTSAANGANIVVNFSGSGSLTTGSYLGVGWQNAGGNTTSTDTFNMSSGSLITGGVEIGRFSTHGIFNLSGGTVTDNGILRLANNSSGGTVAPTGVLNITGGSFSTGVQGVLVGATGVSTTTSNATGTISIGAGSFSSTGTVTLANTSYATGTINLNGGTFTAPQINTTTGTTHSTSTFNFNGGTLTAAVADNSTFLQGLTTANVRNNGAVVDSADFNITIAQNLLHSTIGGDDATDGGLTKSGSGTLTLTGNNTYTGDTTVLAGTLSLAHADLNDDADVNVALGATLDLSFATTDTIGSLFYNGVNLGPGTFNSSNSSFITGTGSLHVLGVAVPAPAALPAGLVLLGLAAANRRRR